MPYPSPMPQSRRALHAVAVAVALCATVQAEAKHLYQYTDAQGVVHFTDIKPGEDVKEVKSTTVRVDAQALVRTREEGVDADRTLVFVNTSGGPVTVELALEQAQNVRSEPPLPARIVLPGRTDTRAVRLTAERPQAGFAYTFRYRYMPGDWRTTPDANATYRLPFDTAQALRVTQAFGGKGSHTDAQNYYAVDIALPLGTPVLAARDGVVMTVDNDYFGAGLDLARYAERANNIRIVHADGSMAVYAHLALESARVQVGEHVRAGQTLALSGDTGYTSGPHLHFCVQRNADMDLVSIPFRFTDAHRGMFTPEAGMLLGGD